MTLEEKITADMKAALKSGRKEELSALRTLLSQIKDERIKHRPKRDINDEDVTKVLLSAQKKRKESIEMYLAGGRDDLVEKEKQELSVIERYLPEQLSKDEILEIVNQVVNESGATSVKDMGKVMGAAMAKLKGKADGKVVQNLVRERLNQLSQ